MADTVQPPVRFEDVAQLQSRISWGAILAGVVTALACSLVLTLFFAGIGLSLTATDIRSNALEIGALVAAVVTVIVAMFVGGWVTTQLTAGETSREAVIHGVLCWAAVTGVALFLAVSGVRATGYFALMGGAMVTQNAGTTNWQEAARQAGIPQGRIDQWRADLQSGNVAAAANDPQNQEQARRAAIVTAWASLIGVLLSMGAAIGGAVAGCGPHFRLFPTTVSRERREIIIAQ
jgi:uncharacterized Tic20 family protein